MKEQKEQKEKLTDKEIEGNKKKALMGKYKLHAGSYSLNVRLIEA